MSFHEVNTRIDQPMEHDIHQGLEGWGEYKDWSTHGTWYSPRSRRLRWIQGLINPWNMIFTKVASAASAEVNIVFHGLINPCIHRNWKSLIVLLYEIKSNLSQYSIEFINIYCCKALTLFPRHPCLPNVCHY
jgi:hypothetical protein